MSAKLMAGAAAVDVTPGKSMFLFGYPHVERNSTGVHDPLWSSALYLHDGKTGVIFVANDMIFVDKGQAERCRQRITQATGVAGSNVLISATHTHSGPITTDYIAAEADPVVPRADAEYVKQFEDGIVAAATQAYKSAQPAQVGLARADATGVGTNRRDPKGPADLEVPVLMVRSADGQKNIAVMLVCCMHPTVLHEDSKLISGDFPGLARIYLQKNVVGADCPVLYHTGPAGNQSPRHVTRENTFAEAQRLGEIVGKSVARVIGGIEYRSSVDLAVQREFVNPPRRKFPSVEEAEKKLRGSIERLEHLRKTGAPRQQVRTAECDWFGAEETVTLAKAEADGRLAQVAAQVVPAEVQIIRVGSWNFVGWPGECFIEFELAVKKQCPNTFVIAYANGEMQGYMVTQEAVDEGGYEASNAVFASPQTGQMLVDATVKLLGKKNA